MTVGREGGQSTVELALLLPLLAMLMLVVAQVAVTSRAQVLTVHAAREAARAAAVSGGDPSGAAEAAARRAGALDPGRLEVVTRRGHDHVTAEVVYRDPTEAPLVGRLLPEVVLRADATMRAER